jgi:two-component system, cell cycle sensor histidine kinase and response regulator CckA
MPASQQTGQFRSFRVIALLKQLVGRAIRFRRATSGRPGGPSALIDLGDLAVAQLVHDLRNQLTVMMGCAENLTYLVPPGQADLEIAELQDSADRALRLTRELLMAARPRPAARLAVDLNHVVAPIAETLSHAVGDRIRLRVQLSAEPVPVVAELVELERILMNLALNARDAMAGEGVLTIETAVVDPSSNEASEVSLPPSRAHLIVSDTGHGMTPEIRARMFEPFFTTKDYGTGLGLSSVAFTVRQLGGTVLVESKPGRGTSVSVLLPLAAHRL